MGQTITIPNIVSGSSNAASSFQPYDPSKVVGDTSPNLPVQHPHHTWLGDVLPIVVAVIVTVMTGGIGGAILGSILSQGVEIAAGNQHGLNWGSEYICVDR